MHLIKFNMVDLNKICLQDKKVKIFSACSVVLAGIFITLFNHWEPGGETWGYWFFSRVLSETGRFAILDRSPLYTLYLNLFRWFEYPGSVTAEYIVTSCIVTLSLTALFRKYIGLWPAVLASLIWLPFLQMAEPPVQKLALACSCLAIMSRSAGRGNFYFALSYALLGLAYLFRGTYIVMIAIFATWDVFKLIKYKGIKPLILALRPQLNYWPVIIVIMLTAFFSFRQSSHPWNNVYFASAKWFPSEGKTFSDGVFVQAMNWVAIKDRYGAFEGKDFYFTNKEFFGTANTMPGLIKANPKLITKLLLKNVKFLLPETISAVSPVNIFRIYLESPLRGYFMKSLRWLLVILVFIGIIYGAFRAAKDESISLFIAANIALICTTVLCLPKARYSVPFIPVLILSAYWYGVKLRDEIIKLSRSLASRMIKRVLLLFGFLCMPVMIIVFSNGPSNWTRIATGLAGDLIRGEARIMEEPPYSIKSSFTEISQLVKGCRGVMALENLFIGAFMDIPVNKVYSVYDIPPFGQLGNSSYDGMTPERLNCILVSHELKTGVGPATNYQIRYQNYIRPYVERLRNLGANTYELGKLGEIVMLKGFGNK